MSIYIPGAKEVESIFASVPKDIYNIELYGESQQKQYSGKNLLKNTATDGTTSSGLTFTVKENKSITISGTNSTQIAKLVAEHTLENGEYILSGRHNANCFLRVSGYKSGSWVYITQTSSSDNVKFTMDNSVYSRVLIQCVVLENTSLSNVIIYPMIRLASVTDATYEPFVGNQPSPSPSYPQDIDSVVVSEIKSVGKNLFNYKEVESTWYKKEGSEAFRKAYKLEPNMTYTLSAENFNLTNNASFCFIVSGYDLDFSPITSTNGITNVTPNNRSVVTDADGYLTVATYINRENHNIADANIQLEKGNKTEYEPYNESKVTLSTPITLRGIGNVKDVLCKQDGVYGVLREFKLFSINGTTTIYREATESNGYRYRTDIISDIKTPPTMQTKPEMLSNMFSPIKWTDVYYGRVNGIGTNSKVIGWFFDEFKEYTLEEMKAYLTNTPLTGVYKLLTPTFEPLPEADNEQLNNIKIYTNTSTDGEIKPNIKQDKVWETKRIVSAWANKDGVPTRVFSSEKDVILFEGKVSDLGTDVLYYDDFSSPLLFEKDLVTQPTDYNDFIINNVGVNLSTNPTKTITFLTLTDEAFAKYKYITIDKRTLNISKATFEWYNEDVMRVTEASAYLSASFLGNYDDKGRLKLTDKTIKLTIDIPSAYKGNITKMKEAGAICVGATKITLYN